MINQARPVYYLAFSIVAQVLALAGALVLMQLLESQDLQPRPFVMLLIGSVGAYLAVSWLNFPRVWRLLNLFILPAAVASLLVNLPIWLFTLVAAWAVLLYLPTLWTGVPYYPTSAPMYELVAEQIGGRKNFRFIDLGCGFGGLLVFLAQRFPEAHFWGVEISPLAYLLSRIRKSRFGCPNVQIDFQDFWKLDLSKFDVVYAFLAPGPMPELWKKVQKELQPGSVFLTNSFEVEATPAATFEIDDKRKSKLFVHRF
ncbi:MAG: class I SAM-dependent methyltransferase [Oligoflexia bacterium]|nr:class I SAM-dependent methyltransferase [Oligoflexia bacterium]